MATQGRFWNDAAVPDLSGKARRVGSSRGVVRSGSQVPESFVEPGRGRDRRAQAVLGWNVGARRVEAVLDRNVKARRVEAGSVIAGQHWRA